MRLAPILAALLAACAGPAATIKPGYDFTGIRRVALLGFDDFPRQPGSGNVVASIFEKHLLGANYSVVERRRVSDILREHAFSASGAVDPRTAKSLGQLLGVDALILGSITSFSPGREGTVMVDRSEDSTQPVMRPVTRQERVGDQWVPVTRDEVVGYRTIHNRRREPQTYTVYASVGVAARMVDVKTGEVLWIGSDTETGYDLEGAAEDAAQRILKSVKSTWPKLNPS
ncbi:MAG TPA: CsgG/HfaB family protein [Elusimicrobiota bacterium]|jgi:hypothetical protein|nr:CsgG/HfaB family protein [Elusimicrobiota bacterium]